MLLLLGLVDAVYPLVPVLLYVLLAVDLLQLNLPVPSLFQSQLLLPVPVYLLLVHVLYFLHLLVPVLPRPLQLFLLQVYYRVHLLPY